MTRSVGDARPPVVRFDARSHDRSRFESGVDQVDNFLKHTANKLAKADNLRVFVILSGDGDVIGFYALNAHAIDYAELPDRFGRARARHGFIPAAFIAMIGVDRRHQNMGLGTALLIDCLERIDDASAQLGIAVTLLDILNCGDESATRRRAMLYASFGFTPLPSNPDRMFLPVATIRALAAAHDQNKMRR